MPEAEFVSWEAIIPSSPELSEADLIAAYKRALRSTKFFIMRDFKATTRTWDHQPNFIDDSEVEDGIVIRTRVYTDDEIYGFVNNGTTDHMVVSTRGPVFPMGFSPMVSPKTRPGVIGSQAGAHSGKIFRTGSWTVRGAAPRNFDMEIAQRHQSTLADRCAYEIEQLIMKRAAQ